MLPAGTPVDLENCEREPIHIPGSVQPHGVLLTVADPSGPVLQVSDNCAMVFGTGPDELLGSTLDQLFGQADLETLTSVMLAGRVATTGTPLRMRSLARDDELDAVVHRSGSRWIVELEPQLTESPLVATLHEVRTLTAELGATRSIEELLEAGVQHVRALTGFDRVMVYRFDRDWNGEVVAEAKRDDLEAFRGLHYPAGDIPPQARALYAVNWLRFIRDVDAVNSPLVPMVDPELGEPLDLSLSVLRSVSPIHCQYLRNMGVRASMSVSLIIDGELAGLIACHQYAGPYVPSPLVRATCEFLAQTLSMMLAERERDERMARSAQIQRALATVTTGTRDTSEQLSAALERHAEALLAMVGAGGMSWVLDGATHAYGDVPDEPVLERLRAWGRSRSTDDGLVATDHLGEEEPTLAAYSDTAAGLLMIQVADGQDVMFLRPEVVHTVDWGGNPHLKELRTDADGVARLSPRGSFALWRETVQQRSAPWEEGELEAAATLRTHLVHLLYERNRAMATVAEALQRSLLPERLPAVPGWELAADYRPASAGVGGDWYDALLLPDGDVLLVLGDIAGHGLAAAGAMAQMRNALRAYAVEDSDPAVVLTRLDRLVALLTPDEMVTAAVARLDPASGSVTVASAGHPAPVVTRAGAGYELLPVDPGPPLGTGLLLQDPQRTSVMAQLAPGDALLMASDGMFERRDQALDASLQAFAGHVGVVVRTEADPASALHALLDHARPSGSDDDATLLLVVRADQPR